MRKLYEYSVFGKPTNSRATGLEDEINQWLSWNEGIEIVRVEQSACGGSFNPSLWMISIWYNEHESESAV